MAIVKKKDEERPTEIQVTQLERGELDLCILGTSPFISNTMSFKAMTELLSPRGKLTSADKAANLKHDPLEEYRSSVCKRRPSEKGPTRVQFFSSAFHHAIADPALDLPGVGVNKTKISRLTWVVGDKVDFYGIPQLYMCSVRMADMNRTPDVRTRAIFPHWACRIRIQYAMPMVTEKSVINLLSAGGVICGVGDGRQQKGTFSFGQFAIVNKDDPDFVRIIKEGGMAAQDEALESPICYDSESEALLAWFTEDRAKRGREKDARPELKEKLPPAAVVASNGAAKGKRASGRH